MAGCGYTLKGSGSFLPDYIRSIAVMEFQNATDKFELEKIIYEKIEEEFTTRGNFNIQPGQDGADASLTGTILSYTTRPKSVDESGRATSYVIQITIDAVFRDLRTNRPLFEGRNYSVSEEYQLSDSEDNFLDQEEYAVEAAALRLAESLVSAILEGF